ncbi:MAG TPA: type II CAAX endopeptidase family protein [Candidatus Limnocylindria bacterium]|nr:type II CAAX endopeptidase family protein [Candidatus Limnocylindria bacterium]
MDDPAETPIAPELESAPVTTPEPANRYAFLQLLAIALIAGGLAGAIAVVGLNAWVLDVAQPRPTDEDSGLVLTGVTLSAVAVLLGIGLHIGRSLVAREALALDRYRGPSLIVLLMLAIVAANFASLSVVNDALALTEGRAPSIYGSLVILTITQAAMLGVAAIFVAAPRALEGLSLLPAKGLFRSMGLGLLLAIPAWIGAQLLAVIVARLLELAGLRPDEGIAEVAINLVDPVVLAIALVIVAPVAEEIFFRGIVYNAWLREYGPRRALMGSAILFALIHGSIFVLVPIFALGVALAVVYRGTGSLPAAIAMHAGFNGITLCLGLLVRYNVIQLP